MSERVQVAYYALSKLKAHHAVMIDHIYVVESPIWSPVPSEEIMDHPDKCPAIIIVGANRYKSLGLLQPYYQSDTKPTEIVFDELVECDHPTHPWFHGIEFQEAKAEHYSELSKNEPVELVKELNDGSHYVEC